MLKQKGFTIISVIIILIVSVIIQGYCSRCGLLLTDDSFNYLSAAKSFSSSGKFLSPDGTYFTSWPPLFPIILSFISTSLKSLWLFNILLKILIGLMLAVIAEKILTNNLNRLIYLLVSMCGVHLVMISVFVWSELIFLFLILLNFLCAVAVRQNKLRLLLLIITGFLMCFQRNAGIFYIGAIVIWLMVEPFVSLKLKLINSLCFAFLSSVGLLIWYGYITSMPGAFNISAYRFFEDPGYNLAIILSRIGELFLTGPHVVTIIGALIIFGVAGFSLYQDILVNRDYQLLSLAIIIYIACFSLLGKLDPHEVDRFISVIVPFLYLFTFVALEKLTIRYKDLSRITLFLLIIWTSYPMLRTWTNAQLWHNRSCLTDLNK